MLSFPPTVQVHISHEPVDMRKSYDGLSGCVEQILHADPLIGHLFVFFNRSRTHVKILVWDRTGYCIYGKRLEQGRFAIPQCRYYGFLANRNRTENMARCRAAVTGVQEVDVEEKAALIELIAGELIFTFPVCPHCRSTRLVLTKEIPKQEDGKFRHVA